MAIKDNQKKAAKFCKYVIDKGYAPICPTLFLPSILNAADSDEEHKAQDICIDLMRRCDCVFVFGDILTDGMRMEIMLNNKPITFVSQSEIDEYFRIKEAATSTAIEAAAQEKIIQANNTSLLVKVSTPFMYGDVLIDPAGTECRVTGFRNGNVIVTYFDTDTCWQSTKEWPKKDLKMKEEE
jgi:hypothetical protein